MYIELSDIFFYENTDTIETELNSVLDKYELDKHKNTVLYSAAEFFKIENLEDHSVIASILKTPNKRTHRFVDIVSILFQYFILSNKSDSDSYRFIRDLNKIILTKTDVKNFKYCRLISSEEHPAIVFKLLNRPYFIEAIDSNITDGIKMISVYNMHQDETEDYDRNLFIPIVVNKAVKTTGNIFISLSYEMMLYVYYYFSFIKGTSAWNDI